MPPLILYCADPLSPRKPDWIIVELGDGQVAGLPDGADAGEFYRALAAN